MDEGAWKVIMVDHIKHYMNPLHIYCRLRDMGIKKGKAKFLCRIYENTIFKHFLEKETPDKK